ncbi:hypothetical protein TNCV_500571 [Trichonephila clavipes]|nr:hypothetical protein TNCV_500571 [Trichonephila clavipes]
MSGGFCVVPSLHFLVLRLIRSRAKLYCLQNVPGDSARTPQAMKVYRRAKNSRSHETNPGQKASGMVNIRSQS